MPPAALSAYVPLRKQTPIVSEENKKTPVLMCHGDMDQVVAFHFGRESSDQLKEAGVDVEFKVYPGMAHSACPAELAAFGKFVKAHTP
jgi:lysophospholipase-2